jgi:hypothetical protein
MSFAFDAREWRRGMSIMLETHIMMSSSIFASLFFSRVPYCFSHGANHRSYGFGSRESGLVPGRFDVNPRFHLGIRSPRRHGFPVRGVYSHYELTRFDGSCFPHHGSHPTRSNGEVQRIVKTSLCHMVKCWIPKIFLTNPSTEPSTFSHSMLVMDGGMENKWLMNSGCS